MTLTKLFSRKATIAAAAMTLVPLSLALSPMAEAAMMKKHDKMMMHKCKKGDKKCEMKMMKMKHK